MIERITIAETASYGFTAQALEGLSQFNYVYGPNGAGKTTISKVIANEAQFPSCSVDWANGTSLKAFVYNREFVDKNFTQTRDLRGIFTLGEGHIEIDAQLTAAKAQMQKISDEVDQLRRTLGGEDGTGGKKGELAALEEEIKEEFWKQKVKHEAHFKGAFTGLLKSKDKFKDRILTEAVSPTSVPEVLEALKNRAETVFDATSSTLAALPTLSPAILLAAEAHPVLGKAVVGKSDVDIAAMIERVQSSDWVKRGRDYFDPATRICPFCQQVAKDSLSVSLTAYFDETFLADTDAIATLVRAYRAASEEVAEVISRADSLASKYLDRAKFKVAADLLRERLTCNQMMLGEKQKEPSQKIRLEPIGEMCAAVGDLILAANKDIQIHNATIANLANERATLTSQIWNYIVQAELKATLADFKTKRAGVLAAITNIERSIAAKQIAHTQKVREIQGLERQVTTIQPTIDQINGLLFSYGFRGFKLAKAAEGLAYRLVRLNGDDAKETLSEGEKTFITFLYFYHLLKGSETEADISASRIVVFDDPVSSLDSDILFIVGSLIKGVIEDARSDCSLTKQVFVLTHNILFHKEVTFNLKRRSGKLVEETFWTVRKVDGQSLVERHESNPIQTGYELLWGEVRRTDLNGHTIQNTLRRILEYYFKIFGGRDPHEIIATFGTSDRLVCKSLLAWVNEGSHFGQDDLYVTIDLAMIENYLRVFKMIFVSTGHEAHYNMMMRSR